ncbi:MAG: HIT domain-containing protein [Chlamydiales bacterium]|nr:HIT domain-containing protein [Chlamydiales bacterium]
MAKIECSNPLGCDARTAIATSCVITAIVLIALSVIKQLPPYGYAGSTLLPAAAAIVISKRAFSSKSVPNNEKLTEKDFSAPLTSIFGEKRSWKDAESQELIQLWTHLISNAIDNYQISHQRHLSGAKIQLNDQGWSVHSMWREEAPPFDLDGIPSGGKHDAATCMFCTDADLQVVKQFQGGLSLITEKESGQPLIFFELNQASTSIPVHWIQLSDDEIASYISLAQKVCQRLSTDFTDEKFFLEMRCGAPGGQSVWHLHIHINKESKTPWSTLNWQSSFSS